LIPSISSCEKITLPKLTDDRGTLSFVHGLEHIPFEIQRVYFLYGVPAGSSRGGHAHRKLQQLLIPVSGSFDVLLTDGRDEESVSLNRPFEGLLINSMIWRELENFSSGAVCLVLASRRYDEGDYIRDFDSYLEEAKA